MLTRLSLRLRIALFFCLIGLGSVAIFAGSLAFAWSRTDPPAPVDGYVTAGLLAGFLCLALVALIWQLFDENVGRAIERLAAQLRARAHTDVAREIDAGQARYLGDLAPAAEAITDHLRQAKSDVAETVAEQTARQKAATERLTSLLADVPSGILLCSPRHQLVFYNAPAVTLLRNTGRPRLDRSVFDLLREGPIRETYSRLLTAPPGRQDAEMLVSTTRCGRALAAHMRLVSGALGIGATPGYVLTLRDVTADLAVHQQRERLLSDTIAAIRPVAASLRSLLDVRAEAEEAAEPDRDVELAILAEAERLTDRVHEIAARADASQTSFWPRQEVRARDFIDGLRARLEPDGPAIEAPPPEMRLRIDAFTVISLLARILGEVKARGLADTVSMRFEREEDEDGVTLVMSWQGDPLGIEPIRALLQGGLEDAPGGLTGREALDHHGTDLWPETDGTGQSSLILPLPEVTDTAEAEPRRRHIAERPVVFDFDLMARTDSAGMTGKRLSELTYVVFDTETTGLDPAGGDEIVQIAAVRLMNGRRVEGEVLDTLVDPERPIPSRSTAVHGISAEMVRGAPKIAEAGAYFARFAENAVLVAHNAPFDMAFFHRHAGKIGHDFDNPVFDTVLLSAMLFGQGEEHTLDALAARFGVVIPEEVRHTAYGDTVATAEVFERMLPMLEAKGFRTFDDVQAEMQRNTRLLREMKARVSG